MQVQNKPGERQFSPGELAGTAGWKVSSRSGSEGSCVEVKFLPGGSVAVRDNTQPDGQVTIFTGTEWAAFVGGVKDGEFDLPVGA